MTPIRVTDRAGNARISKGLFITSNKIRWLIFLDKVGWQRSRNENGTIETVNKDKTSVSGK
jgi:hypothetical protein